MIFFKITDIIRQCLRVRRRFNSDVETFPAKNRCSFSTFSVTTFIITFVCQSISVSSGLAGGFRRDNNHSEMSLPCWARRISFNDLKTFLGTFKYNRKSWFACGNFPLPSEQHVRAGDARFFFFSIDQNVPQWHWRLSVGRVSCRYMPAEFLANQISKLRI